MTYEIPKKMRKLLKKCDWNSISAKLNEENNTILIVLNHYKEDPSHKYLETMKTLSDNDLFKSMGCDAKNVEVFLFFPNTLFNAKLSN